MENENNFAFGVQFTFIDVLFSLPVMMFQFLHSFFLFNFENETKIKYTSMLLKPKIYVVFYSNNIKSEFKNQMK